MKELVLRRSASERKLAKEKKKERKEKALSVHFGEKTLPGLADFSPAYFTSLSLGSSI